MSRPRTRPVGTTSRTRQSVSCGQPKAVIITPTDAPASAGAGVRTATRSGGGRKIPANAARPDHVRGLPGRAGAAGRFFTGFGTALAGWALLGDIERGDVPMGIGDAFSFVGGGLEIYAIAVPGAAIAGVSAMTAGWL